MEAHARWDGDLLDQYAALESVSLGTHRGGLPAGFGSAARHLSKPRSRKILSTRQDYQVDVPLDDRSCRIVAWRHFNDTLDVDGKGDRSAVGLNKVDFVGQTGVERSYEEGQVSPGDYEAQVSQGEITIHADEQLGTTDGGVARYPSHAA